MNLKTWKITDLLSLDYPQAFYHEMRAVAFRVTATEMVFDVDNAAYKRVYYSYHYGGSKPPRRRNTGPRPRVLIVIGHFNMPNALELNIAAIRHFNGDSIPILISDDCSDGFAAIPDPKTPYGHVLRITHKYPNVFVWPNHFRIGHAGGDLGAFWKGLNWAGAGAWDGQCWRGDNGYDILFKLSQRFIFTDYDWARHWARILYNSNYAAIGKGCTDLGFDLRTEAVGLKVAEWFTPKILAHLCPRPIGIATEAVVYEVLDYWLEKRLLSWEILSDGRNMKSDHYLFRGANSPDEYVELARLLGLSLSPIVVKDSNQLDDYIIG